MAMSLKKVLMAMSLKKLSLKEMLNNIGPNIET